MFESVKKLYPFSSNFLKLSSGDSMHYIEKGRGNKEVLLMIHGNPTWSFYYRNLVNDLSQNYHCIAIDHIGCGLSSKGTKTLRLQDRIDQLQDFVVKKDLKNITVISHDWGGAIGAGLVLAESDRIKRIVFSNTAAFNSKKIPLSIAISRTRGLGTFLNRSLNAFSLAATFRTTVNPLHRDVKAGYLLPYNNYENRKAVDDFVKDIPLRKTHPTYKTLSQIESGLSSFKKPTLLLWGDRDFCFTIHFRKRFLDFVPHAEVISLKNAGHYVLEDAYEESLSEIQKFLKKETSL